METNKPPTLEDLIKLKKAEQPRDAFWDKFDKELQEKTLQTFILKEPWYENLTLWVTHHFLSASFVSAIVCFLGLSFYFNSDSDKMNELAETSSYAQKISVFEKMSDPIESVDYALVANDALEKDYSVEVIGIKDIPETYNFEEDAISIASSRRLIIQILL